MQDQKTVICVVLNLKKHMNRLEKFVFLQLTWKQFAKMDESEYYKNLSELSKEEDVLSVEIGSEIHRIYSYINSNIEGRKKVNSIEEYNNEVSPVSDIIIKTSLDFGLTLKGEVSEEFKKAVLNILGRDYLDDFLNKTNN